MREPQFYSFVEWVLCCENSLEECVRQALSTALAQDALSFKAAEPGHGRSTTPHSLTLIISGDWFHSRWGQFPRSFLRHPAVRARGHLHLLGLPILLFPRSGPSPWLQRHLILPSGPFSTSTAFLALHQRDSATWRGGQGRHLPTSPRTQAPVCAQCQGSPKATDCAWRPASAPSSLQNCGFGPPASQRKVGPFSVFAASKERRSAGIPLPSPCAAAATPEKQVRYLTGPRILGPMANFSAHGSVLRCRRRELREGAGRLGVRLRGPPGFR